MNKDSRKLTFYEVLNLALCIITAGYGVLVRLVHTTNIFFMAWFLLAFIFLFLFLDSRRHIINHLPFLLRTMLILVLIIGFIYLIFISSMIVINMKTYDEESLDYIIVLGAKLYGSGELSPTLQYRLDAAYNYLIDNPDTIAIVTGGKGTDEKCSEASAMYDYLISKGISSERIIKEDKATDTVENIKFSMDYIDNLSSVGIVTSNFHLYRACQIAKKLGISNAKPISAKAPALFVPHNVLREILAITKDFLQGNISLF